VELETDLVAELSGHENIVGMKDSRGDMEIMGQLVAACEADFQMLVGSGAALYDTLELGGVGGIMAVAAMAPEASVEVHRAFLEGRNSDSKGAQEQIAPVHNEIVGGTGVPGVKRALDLLGYAGGDPRSPLRSLDEAGETKVRGVLERAGLLDTP
jgi:dihydrodipicolinate synthase/N-acetylneuraminate lyase